MSKNGGTKKNRVHRGALRTNEIHKLVLWLLPENFMIQPEKHSMGTLVEDRDMEKRYFFATVYPHQKGTKDPLSRPHRSAKKIAEIHKGDLIGQKEGEILKVISLQPTSGCLYYRNVLDARHKIERAKKTGNKELKVYENKESLSFKDFVSDRYGIVKVSKLGKKRPFNNLFK